MAQSRYPRLFQAPKGSFFLLGVRGTGKSTWTRNAFPGAHIVDLLDEFIMRAADGKECDIHHHVVPMSAEAAGNGELAEHEGRAEAALEHALHRLFEIGNDERGVDGFPEEMLHVYAFLRRGRCYAARGTTDQTSGK